jgi:Site-specific recombinase XerD
LASNDTLLNFFKEYGISERNQKITLDYIDDFRDTGKGLSKFTIANNTRIMMFILKNLCTDLDKLTKADVKQFKRAVDNYQRKDGKSASKATIKHYLIGFKQFLRWAGESEEYKNPTYEGLIKSISTKIRLDEKNAADMLTEAEIDRMFAAAKEPRDIALISVLAESGCRVGELVSMEIRHVRFTDEFVWVTFPRSKTKSRTLPLKESMTYLANWLSHHPLKDNERAPLWVSLNSIPAKHGGTDRAYQPMNNGTVLQLVYRIAKKAGIKKRCYTHLFRHTAATKLSRIWTEPRMRTYFGWDTNSPMPSLYSHLGAGDLEDAARDRYGTAEERKPEPQFQKCPRCKRELPRRAEYCDVCGTKLGEQQIQKVDDALASQMRHILLDEHPEFLQQVVLAMTKTQKQ